MNYRIALLVASASTVVPAIAAEKQETTKLDEVTVTATREAQSIHESTHSLGQVSESEISEIKPSHPSEVMGRIPGVHVNVTGGEGHMTSIRQPISTSPLYLYLEDGVPTRSTGFFNHNALYEVNVPQALATGQFVTQPGVVKVARDRYSEFLLHLCKDLQSGERFFVVGKRVHFEVPITVDARGSAHGQRKQGRSVQ